MKLRELAEDGRRTGLVELEVAQIGVSEIAIIVNIDDYVVATGAAGSHGGRGVGRGKLFGSVGGVAACPAGMMKQQINEPMI